MAWLQPKMQTCFLSDRRICPSSGPVKQAGTENHLRSPEELIPFERGLRVMQMSRDIGCAQQRRNTPINGWNVEHPENCGGPRGQGKQQRASPRGQDSAAGAECSLAASTGSGSSSQVLWTLIFFLGEYISELVSVYLRAQTPSPKPPLPALGIWSPYSGVALFHAASVADVPGSASLVELPALVRTLSLTQL